MAYKCPADIQSQIEAQLASGHYAQADDVLRDALIALSEKRDADDDLAAVKDAIAQWQAGDEGLPLDEAFDEIWREFGLLDRG